ncbi:hypothetical protein [uncultured Kiloniella sp.]|uniref:hypothetical protein n=1 Tax=uncultured Kiloniella sp. TaxID=1133091 RepID=UPI0026287792|nr:hypothetical protein [uncultured Kiloniella sp.]
MTHHEEAQEAVSDALALLPAVQAIGGEAVEPLIKKLIHKLHTAESHLKASICLNPVQLAERWNLTTATLDNQRANGSGPLFFKPGGRGKRGGKNLYRISDVEAYEQENTFNSTTQVQYRGAR